MLKSYISELEIGDWCFINKNEGDNLYIGIRFLDGDRGLAILPISKEANHDNKQGVACWKWNGNEDAPTLEPSILHWGDGKDKPASWHGYLRDGELVKA